MNFSIMINWYYGLHKSFAQLGLNMDNNLPESMLDGCENLVLFARWEDISGMRVTKPPSSVSQFSPFLDSIKYCLPVECRIHIWQVWPQTICNDT